MKDLVTVKKGVLLTNSILFSKEFEIDHIQIKEKIVNLTLDQPTLKKDYTIATFLNERGREYEMYEFSKSAYMFLVMQFGNAKSRERRILIQNKQLLFISAFEKMEQMLLNRTNSEWITSREQGKSIRSKETDAIKDFVEYAIANGSNGAKFYYKHFTNATYKALCLLEHKKPKTRDTLDLLELNQLVLAEDLVTRVIISEMENKEHYKVIFEKCKVALDKFADSLYLKRSV